MKIIRFDERFSSQYVPFHPGEDNRHRLRRLHRHLPEAMKELTARQQQMIQLHFYENLSISEIARQLAVNPSTVSRCLTRAEARLRRVLRFTL